MHEQHSETSTEVTAYHLPTCAFKRMLKDWQVRTTRELA